MKLLFASINRIEIYHLKNVLEAGGVHVILRNEWLHTVAGEIPFTECGIQLWVTRDEEVGLAERLLADWRRPTDASGSSWQCERCGEWIDPPFDACWRCAAGP